MNPGFIFDCDGTLLDSMEKWRSVETDLAQSADIVLTPVERDRVCAMTIPEVSRFFHNAKGLGKSPEDVVGMIDELMLDYYCHQVEPRKGAVEFVQQLAERGIPCAVTSSSPQHFLQAGLERVGILDCFCAVLSVDDVGHSKREPQIFLRALELMDADAGAAWGVDDAVYALGSMAGVGCRTIGIYDDDIAGTFAQLQAAADVAVHELDELDPDSLLA